MKISLNTVLYNPIFFKDLFYTEAFKAQLLNFSHGGQLIVADIKPFVGLKSNIQQYQIQVPRPVQSQYPLVVVTEKENSWQG